MSNIRNQLSERAQREPYKFQRKLEYLIPKYKNLVLIQFKANIPSSIDEPTLSTMHTSLLFKENQMMVSG